ncbi:zinc ABC transporter substrate-binding protein [Paenibacillus sp. NEAU-GSW1]|uniref:metal ABC transporter solute-binding protein, Zn/Mn family n=1 Tax=Paenibacillus sp. NEAU-GSW1 TaxID=2682486 RepID=UPI0012E13C8C|nr:zinc ABC transporter substrate-binding protein [Paenibacillus sp. NEAU-GSW1]MUT68517.1 manganese transporter [Paenibacillus sp. NEAU-GSW1]
MIVVIKRPIASYPAFKRFIFTILFLSLSVTLFAGCAADQQDVSGPEGKLKVTATTGMIADIVKEVGGENVAAEGLMGAGIDPHLYKASQGDIKKLDDADVIFYNGLHLEGKMAEMFEKLERTKPTVAVSANLKEEQLRANPQGGSGSHDPHIWFNVKLWMSATEVVRDTLAEKDPANADGYKERAAAYLKELDKLDLYVSEQIKLIPEQSRILVTAHDAFGYFGDEYGLQVTGLQGMNTMSEYGSKDVSKLRDFLVDNQIKAVFIESSVPRKSIESVIEGAKQLGHEVTIGGELFSDAMGDEGTVEGTYIGMVKHNVDTIVNALK